MSHIYSTEQEGASASDQSAAMHHSVLETKNQDHAQVSNWLDADRSLLERRIAAGITFEKKESKEPKSSFFNGIHVPYTLANSTDGVQFLAHGEEELKAYAHTKRIELKLSVVHDAHDQRDLREALHNACRKAITNEFYASLSTIGAAAEVKLSEFAVFLKEYARLRKIGPCILVVNATKLDKFLGFFNKKEQLGEATMQPMDQERFRLATFECMLAHNDDLAWVFGIFSIPSIALNLTENGGRISESGPYAHIIASQTGSVGSMNVTAKYAIHADGVKLFKFDD